MTGENTLVTMERENSSNDKPVCKSVATNCASDFPHLLSSSPSASSSSGPSACHSDSSSNDTLPPSETDMLSTFHADQVRIYRNAKNRLATFKSYNWPKENVDTRDLAEAGFFLPEIRQLPDEVECIFCRVKVGNWSPEVDPFSEHLKHSPRCDFMSGYIVNNIPLGGTPATDPIRGANKRTPNLDVCGPCPPPSAIPIGPSTSSSSTQSSPSTPLFPAPFSPNFASQGTSSSYPSRPSESVSIQSSDPSSSIMSVQQLHRPPRHTNYITTASRQNTYPPNWCPQLCPVASSDLAEAGFFYSGPVQTDHNGPTTLYDVVTCFHCDRKVFNWSETDDPWQEHYRLNKSCHFIELNYRPSRQSVQPASAGGAGVPPSQSCTLRTQVSTEASQSPLDDVSPLSRELSVISSQESTVSKEDKPTELTGDEFNASCKVCYTNRVEFLFLPCKHASCCGQCTASLTTCPLCRTFITGSVRIYLT